MVNKSEIMNTTSTSSSLWGGFRINPNNPWTEVGHLYYNNNKNKTNRNGRKKKN